MRKICSDNRAQLTRRLRKFEQVNKWSFCLTAGTLVAANQERRMSRRARRNHTPAFKAKVALAAIKGDGRWPNWPSSSTSTPIRLRRGRRSWRVALPEFLDLAALTPATPAIDVKSLHAKIGQLTLENDFLEGALTKAGLLSAKR